MDQNVLGIVDDSIDPTIFNFDIDLGNSGVSPNDQDNCFKWVDDFITSTELEEPTESINNGGSASTSQAVQGPVHIQQVPSVQHQLLQNVVLQQQQPQTSNLGNVIMAMGQPSHQQNVAIAASTNSSQAQLLQNQATILQRYLPMDNCGDWTLSLASDNSNLANQHLGSPFILKTSSGTSIQLTPTAVTQAPQSTSNVSASPQHYLIAPSQSSSPLLGRSITPSQTVTQPSSVGQTQVGMSVSAPSNLHLLQLQQSQQITQQVQLSNFVTNQSNLPGHAVLTAPGSNIVHTQNALIQNPNVVNVNVAHVLPNQLPQLQGTILQTAQGKILIQSPANSQQLSLSTLSSLGHMTSAQPVHFTSNANSSGVTQQQPSFNLINLGGSQGHVLLQRMPTSSNSVQATSTQGPILLRAINGQQQLLQQPNLQSTTTVGIATSQIPQQLMAQAGNTQNIPLQQLVTGGGQSLRLVGQPTTATAQPQVSTTVASNVVLQPLVASNQVHLVGQQASSQTGTKPATVTLNLAGQNLSLQQLQSLQGLQLTSGQQQQIILHHPAASSTAVQQAVGQPATQEVSGSICLKKSKSKSFVSSSSTPLAVSNSNSAIVADNILSAALMSSGILDDEIEMLKLNGSEYVDSAISQTVSTPTPPPPATTPKNKKKKKKKETNADMVQPVVLSSTTAKPAITITTASATVVTTTISQSSVSLASQTVMSNTYTLSPSPVHVPLSSHNVTMTTASLPTIGMPTVAIAPTVISSATTTNSTVNSTVTTGQMTTPVRGKHGSPLMTKTISGLQSLSDQEKQQVIQIQKMLNRLKEKTTRDENDLALMRELEGKLKRIWTQAHTQAMAALKQQQGLALQGQPFTVQGQASQGTLQQTEQPNQTLSLSSSVVGQPWVTQSPQPTPQTQLKLDIKPVVGTPSAPVLHIQPKSNAKIRLVSPKLEPGTGSYQSQDTKPLLLASNGQTCANSSVSVQLNQGTTYQTTTGNVIMTMSGAGQAGSGQPQVLRIQIGNQKSQAPLPTVTVTCAQQMVVQPTQKIVMAANTTTTMSTTNTTSSAVSAAVPDPPRPVQIKIANQVLTLQLTPQQQEKLELHLSRMTLEQQQAFLRMQQHILAKLQLRDPQTSTQTTALQGTSTATVGTSAGAPTVVSVGTTSGDSTSKSLPLVTPPSTTASTTPVQQLPITVQQALESSQPKTDNNGNSSVASTTVAAPIKRVNLEIPKASIIHSQLGKDQEHAVSPDVKTPFKDHREATRRLLRFHVFQSKGPTQEEFNQFDSDFEIRAEELVEKKSVMLAKYRLLLMEDSMRTYPTSEQVLISRMWSNEMQTKIREEKQQVENDTDSFMPMPMVYLEKDLTQVECEESEEEYEDNSSEVFEDEHSERDEVSDEGSRDADGDSYTAVDEYDRSEDSRPYDEESSSPCYSYQERDVAAVVDKEVEEEPSFSHHRQGPLNSVGASFSHLFNASSQGRKSSDASRESSPKRKSSPRRESSSPGRKQQTGIHSESSRSSPPCSEPLPRTMVRLVIRNDGKGFTSKVVERRRSSVQAECRMLRSRSHSGQERAEVKKETKREVKKNTVTEEVEYIDVDNSKYNRGVSVTLERLPEKTSQEYGLSLSNKASINSSHRTSCDGDDKNMWDIASGSENKSISSRSAGGRKRRRDEAQCTPDENWHTKREHLISGFCGSVRNEVIDAPFRDLDETRLLYRNSPVREFYVGSAMEPLEHFESDDEGRPYVGDEDDVANTGVVDARVTGAGRGSRPLCSSSIIPSVSSNHTHSHLSSVSDTQTTDSLHRVHSVVDYVMGSEEEQSLSEHKPSEPHPGRVFGEFTTQSSLDSGRIMPQPPFAEQIPDGLIETDRMFDTSPNHEMESSFELDNPDPQRSMVNPQVQSAIDSILNASGNSESDGRQGRLRTRSSASLSYSTSTAETGLDYDTSIGRSNHLGDVHQSNVSQDAGWDEEDSEHDLHAAVQSILR